MGGEQGLKVIRGRQGEGGWFRNNSQVVKLKVDIFKRAVTN